MVLRAKGEHDRLHARRYRDKDAQSADNNKRKNEQRGRERGQREGANRCAARPNANRHEHATLQTTIRGMRQLKRNIFLSTGPSFYLSLLLLACAPLSQAESQVDAILTRGDMAPDFTLPVLANPPARARTGAAFELLKLSDYRGTVVYLDFWQVSCAPCREAMPKLNALREEFAREDVEILAVNTDISPRAALEFAAANAVAYPIVGDPAGQVADRYGAHTLPTAFLISREGKVARVHRGFDNKDVDKIRDLLRALSSVRPSHEDNENVQNVLSVREVQRYRG